MRALGALHQFQPGTSLKAWLFTIQRNAFYEHQRRRRREAVALADSFDLNESSSPGQDARSAVTDLQQLIWTLPPLLREALILVGAQELTHEEAARVCERAGRHHEGAAVPGARGAGDGRDEGRDGIGAAHGGIWTGAAVSATDALLAFS